MKNQSIRFITMLALLGISALFFVSSAGAEANCSNATLVGRYAYSADGFVTEMAGEFTPIAEAGIFTFDGAGSFTTTNVISVGGQIFPRTAEGTYNVESNCTGTGTVTGNVDFSFAITRPPRSIHFVVTTPTVAVKGTMQK